MLIRALVIAACLAFAGGGAFAQGYNPSNVGQITVRDCSLTIASGGTSQQVLALSGTAGGAAGSRTKVILQNTSPQHTMGFSFVLTSGLSWNTTTGTYILQPNASWTSDPDALPINALWAVGQTNDVLVCNVSGQ